MPIVHIDFETQSKVDIKTCGAGRYAQDPSTRILCICWAVDNGPIHGSLGDTIPLVFWQAIREGWQFSAFNAIFEQLIWTYRWPSLPLPQFICTRALAAAHGLPQGLDRACKALSIGWTKDVEGSRLINMYSIPKKDGGFNELKGEDAQKMLKYCAKDVDLSRRIMQRLPALSKTEQRVYDWTVEANLRGINIDVTLAEKAEGIADALQKDGNRELSVLTGNTIFSVSQIARIKSYLKREFGVTSESLDKEAIEELLLSDSLPDTARRILELRRDLSQTSVKKFNRARLSVCDDGKIRDTLVYHGAATGRWTSQVVQFQNLPKYASSDPETAMKLINHGDPQIFKMCYEHPMLTLSGCIRGLIVPEEGGKLAVVDYNAIEARVLMWAAGQEDAVAAFHQGRDIYVEMARLIYRNPALTKENKKERNLGKQATLGCSYQMGHRKFQATCDSYGIDLGEKTEYDDQEDKEGKSSRIWYSPLAKRAVETYRTRFPQVPKFWYGMQAAAENCVKTGKTYPFGPFTFSREREFLYLSLPSGRRLAYHRPGADKDGLYYYTEDSQSFSYVKKRTYGGRLVENCLDKDTLVLTMRGCIPIVEVTKEDKVWDGENWVSTGGIIKRGIRKTGSLEGVGITSDHLILVGNSWRRAIDMDEESWRDALKPGLSSVALACSKAGLGMTPQLYASVRAAVNIVAQREPYTVEKSDVKNVQISSEEKKERSIQSLCLKKPSLFGFTGIPAWCLAVMIQITEPIKTTVVAGLESMHVGLSIVKDFWSTQRLYRGGTILDWIWTDVKMIGGMCRGISASSLEKKILGTEEPRHIYFFGGHKFLLWSFGKSIALFGGAVIHSFITLKREEHPKRLWKDTRRREEVYDLLNCGPLNRFTVISAEGPIIVHNCIQALARDILAHGILNLEKQRFKVILTVHDENVVEITDEKKLKEIVEIMCDLPDWAKGCPISAEGFITERYRK